MNARTASTLIGLLATTTTTACASLPLEGSAPRYTSKHRHGDRVLDGFRIDEVTTAPLQIVVMGRFDVPPADMFDLTSRRLPEWFTAIPSIAWDNSNASRPGLPSQGSLRSCELDGDRLVERMAMWREGAAYAYAADMAQSTVPFPVEHHLGLFVVESDGGKGSLVTWRQYYDRKARPTALFVNTMMRGMMVDGFERLAAKYGGELVEPAI